MASEEIYTIYGLEATSAYGAIRYVGRTRHADPVRRLRTHLHAARTGITSPVYDWIRGLLEQGRTVRCIVLERTPDPDAESRWIAKLRERGFVLVNARSGGRSGGSFDAASRARISQSNKAAFASPDVRRLRQGQNSAKAILSDAQVVEMRTKHASGEMRPTELAKLYNIRLGHVKSVIYRRSWKHL